MFPGAAPRGDVEAAVRLWDNVGAPYDAALTLLDSEAEDHWRGEAHGLVADEVHLVKEGS